MYQHNIFVGAGIEHWSFAIQVRSREYCFESQYNMYGMVYYGLQ